MDGVNVDIVHRYAEEHLDRFPLLAAQVVELKPDVILATVTPAVVATRALTKSIPIVCPLLADAINLGLIAAEARPGGNVTGVSFRTQGLTSKQVLQKSGQTPHGEKAAQIGSFNPEWVARRLLEELAEEGRA